MTRDQTITFRAAHAKYADLVQLLGHWGPPDPFEPPTFVTVYDEAASPARRWGGEWLNHVLVDVVAHQDPGWDRPQFVALSEEGHVVFQLPQGDMTEDIPEAGLHRTGAAGWGYMGGLRSIEGDLYAFGYAGQCYRRLPGAGWQRFDEGMRSKVGPVPDLIDLCRDAAGTFWAVDSSFGQIFRRPAKGNWEQVPNPAGEKLYAVTPDPQEGVWIAGRLGSLIRADAGGLHLVDSEGINDSFFSAVWHEDALWLAGKAGLWRHDGRQIHVVDTGLSPLLRSTRRLQSVEGVLWSFGPDDLARRADGKWARIPYPAMATQT